MVHEFTSGNMTTLKYSLCRLCRRFIHWATTTLFVVCFAAPPIRLFRRVSLWCLLLLLKILFWVLFYFVLQHCVHQSIKGLFKERWIADAWDMHGIAKNSTSLLMNKHCWNRWFLSTHTKSWRCKFLCFDYALHFILLAISVLIVFHFISLKIKWKLFASFFYELLIEYDLGLLKIKQVKYMVEIMYTKNVCKIFQGYHLTFAFSWMGVWKMRQQGKEEKNFSQCAEFGARLLVQEVPWSILLSFIQ